MTRYVLMLVGLLALSTPAAAQTGACPADLTLSVNPTSVCVTPSSAAAHNATDPLSATTIVRYDLLFFAPGVDTSTGSPVQTVDLGKPALNAQGAFWLQRAELGAIPVGQQYRARVVAVGATGGVSARSPESNPFGRATAGTPTAPTSVAIR